MSLSMEPSSEEGERATWLGRFALKWTLIALLMALVLRELVWIVSLIVDVSRLDQTAAMLSWVSVVASSGAIVALAALRRTRILWAAALAAIALLLLSATQSLLDSAWSNITLMKIELPIVMIVRHALTSFGLALLTRHPVALALAVLSTVLAALPPFIPSSAPFAYAALIVLVAFTLARLPRALPTRPRATALTRLDALAGFWIGPFLMLGGSWFVAICGLIAKDLAETMQTWLVVIELVALVFVVRAGRAMLGAGVPTSVAGPTITAIALHAVGCAFTVGATLVRVIVSPPRAAASLADTRALADVLFMSAAFAGCIAISLAARWAPDERERARASLSARFALATFFLYLPPFARGTTEQRTLGALALDVFWLAGIIILWKAIHGLRSALARRAFVDTLS